MILFFKLVFDFLNKKKIKVIKRLRDNAQSSFVNKKIKLCTGCKSHGLIILFEKSWEFKIKFQSHTQNGLAKNISIEILNCSILSEKEESKKENLDFKKSKK